MKLAWATDLHLDSVELPAVAAFCAEVHRSGATGLLVTGDIANSTCLQRWLESLAARLDIPLYFVLGNHDYYGSGIQDVQDIVRGITSERLVYLPQTGPVQLDPDTILVGQDGWGDCRHGDPENFEILTDYVAIRDLREQVDQRSLQAGIFQRGPLRKKLAELGDQAAAELHPHLVEAAGRSGSVVVLTHVSPFRESCWYNGAISGETFLPGFTCRAVGDLLVSTAQSNPETTFTVFCGHTHGFGYAEILPNLVVHTGFGGYGRLYLGSVRLKDGRVLVDGPTP